MGALIAGVAITAVASALSGAMGAKAQREAAEIIKNASEEEKKELRSYFDSQFGENSYNAKIEQLGLQNAQDYSDLLRDENAWNKYINGEDAYVAPEEFSFTAEDLYGDPSYNFRMQQGADAVAQQAVAGGLANSTASQKMMNDYAQNFASQEYANAYNRNYTKYNDQRNFDYSVWKNEANQYYSNLMKQLEGMGNVAGWGNSANANKASAFQALAGNINDLTSANAQAQVNSSTAPYSAGQGVVNALGQLGTAYAVSQMGYNPQSNFGSSNGSNVGTASSVQQPSTGQYSYDFNSMMSGWNPNLNTQAQSVPQINSSDWFKQSNY